METRKFVVVGHVDHGKSTLCGNLLYKCGAVGEHEMEKIREEAKKDGMESWSWARILDIYEEEKARGKTMEYTVFPFSTYKNNKEIKWEMIDTPGHKSLIRSMITGINNYDASSVIGCLVISLSRGEFESGWLNGQTKEDCILLRASGIENLIVIFNKMDKINWDRNIYEKYSSQISAFIKPLNFSSVVFMPLSSLNGIGIISTLEMPTWYNGKSLLDILSDVKIKCKINENNVCYKTAKFIVRLKILNCPQLISTGFSCIMHHSTNETDVIFSKLTPSYITPKTQNIITAIISSPPINIFKSQRVIFRTCTSTIGFGIVDKILPFPH